MRRFGLVVFKFHQINLNDVHKIFVHFKAAELQRQKEEEEKRELEEYMKLKEEFELEEEGEERGSEDEESQNLLEEFLEYIKVLHLNDITLFYSHGS